PRRLLRLIPISACSSASMRTRRPPARSPVRRHRCVRGGRRHDRDLFSGDDDGFMDDAALVRRLAIEKLEAKAAELRPQWAWTKAVLDPEYGFMAQYARLRPQPAEVPAELPAEIERIEQRLGEPEELSEDEFTEELMAEAG